MGRSEQVLLVDKKALEPTSYWYMSSQFFVKYPQPALSLRNKLLNLF